MTAPPQISAQSSANPFNWTEPVTVEASDQFLLWNENVGGTYTRFQKVYKVYSTGSAKTAGRSGISIDPARQFTLLLANLCYTG